MESLWIRTAEPPAFKPLESDLHTDALIIGGGFTGILCAYMLDKAGVDYALVEAKALCDGVSKNTTAKITSQHGFIYDRLIREFGVDTARGYLEANEAALNEYRRLSKNIDCHFEERDNYVYSTDDRCKLEREAAALRRLDYPAELVTSLPLPFPVAGALKFPRQAQFNPLQFIYRLAEGLHIYEHTPVKEFIGTKVVTSRGRIFAKRIIVATHFPILNKHGSYFIKLYQQRSYVVALKNVPLPDGMFIDGMNGGLSFRSYENTLLLGGGGHRTGKKGGGWMELEAFYKHYYPNAEQILRWAAQDCMSLDGIPYIGQYSQRTPELYVATGFNKWGMTSSMVAARLLCDLIQGKSNPYSSVFDPSRSILRPQLAINALGAVVNLITPTVPRCPHLGCALKWNAQERTWDCPCHGSRFSEDGKLIDNPATGDLR